MVVDLEADEVKAALAPEQERPAIIEAWAPGCGACYQVGRVLELAAEQYQRIDFYRVNLHAPDMWGAVRHLAIATAPTVLCWHRGAEVRRLENVADAGEIWDLVTFALP